MGVTARLVCRVLGVLLARCSGLRAIGVAGCMVLAVAARADTPRELVAASSGTHVWVAIPIDGGCKLVHHASAMEGSFCRSVVQLERLPQALVASGSALTIIMPASGQPASHAVFALSTERNPATGAFFYRPAGRLDVLASAPSGGTFAGAATDGSSIWVLQHDSPMSLLRLEPTDWAVEPLPTERAGTSLATWSDGAAQVPALALAEGGDLLLWQRRAASDWRETRWPGAAREEWSVVQGSSRPTLLVRESGGLRIVYPTPTGVRMLATMAMPVEPWAIVGVGDGLRLLTVAADGAVRVAPIDPLTGSAGEAAALEPQPTTTSLWLHLPIIGAVTIAMLLAGFIIRPPMKAPRHLPPEWMPLPMARRALALMVDLLPGAGVSLAVTECRVGDLLVMPAWTPDIGQSAPAALMIAVATAWCLVFETVLSTTPGKRLMGARVLGIDAEGPLESAGALRRAIRALLKGVVLFAPALGFLAFVHPLQQGLPETLTRTILVQARPQRG
ncbi:MAG: RDD family protein [Planctomycetes bacterium]|nr:RDD family protein [Planctomycetota bacterium]